MQNAMPVGIRHAKSPTIQLGQTLIINLRSDNLSWQGDFALFNRKSIYMKGFTLCICPQKSSQMFSCEISTFSANIQVCFAVIIFLEHSGTPETSHLMVRENQPLSVTGSRSNNRTGQLVELRNSREAYPLEKHQEDLSGMNANIWDMMEDIDRYYVYKKQNHLG